MQGRLAIALLLILAAAAIGQPLASWRETPTRATITEFVERVTDPSSLDYVPEAERIAVFDNDGTLWAEQPAYFQLLFAMDRIRAMAPEHPEWRTTQPYRAVLEGDMKALAASGEKGILELVMTTHAGMTTEEFATIAREWFAAARHPTTGRAYTEMVYQPMLELLAYLRAHGFKTFIVSGGGIELVRAFAEDVYGIPPEQVVGSSIKTRYVVTDSGPALQRLPEVNFVDDKEGKPVGINAHIGRRPIMAFGNSDGDFQMLEFTTAGRGPRLGILIHHDDADREWAYDRDSHIGRLAQGLDEAAQRGWVLVSMSRDWAKVFPGE